MGRARKALDVAAMVQAYESGEKSESIAERFGVSGQTVRNRLYEEGVQIRRGGFPLTVDLPMDRVAPEYERGDSLSVLALRYGFSTETIRRRLLRHGVKVRDPETGQRMRLGRHGDMAALAADLGRSEQDVTDLLLKHGFIY